MKYILTLIPLCMFSAACSRSYSEDELRAEYYDSYSPKGTVWGSDQIGEIYKDANFKKELRYNK